MPSSNQRNHQPLQVSEILRGNFPPPRFNGCYLLFGWGKKVRGSSNNDFMDDEGPRPSALQRRVSLGDMGGEHLGAVMIFCEAIGGIRRSPF